MNLNNSAMWKAAGLSLIIGIAAHLMLSLIGIGAANAADTGGAIRGILAGTSVVNGFAMIILMMVYGALYGHFARREGSPVSVGDYALGGALTTMFVVIGMIVLALIFGAVGLTLPGVEIEMPTNLGAALAAALTIGALIGLAVDMVLGAIGGALYAAAYRGRETTTTTTPTGY